MASVERVDATSSGEDLADPGLVMGTPQVGQQVSHETHPERSRNEPIYP
jgi:hypothetical protein